jgi:WD40 repeat protein
MAISATAEFLRASTLRCSSTASRKVTGVNDMARYLSFVTSLTVLCTGLAFGQIAASYTPSSTVAYVYVSSITNGQKSEINAYSAAANGQLSKVAGSPFAANVQNITANGKYLFGSNGVDVDSFSVESAGALKLVSSINAQGFNSNDCGGPFALFFDRTGTTLYDVDVYSDCSNNAYQFFGVEASSGALTYQGVTSATSPLFDVPLSFIGNNEYGFGSLCYQYDPTIFGFQRASDGTLTFTNFNAPFPDAPNGDFYCPYLAAADSTNHVAVPLDPMNQDWQPSGRTQLATYTADASGNLTTTSTYSNMPETLVTNISNIWVSSISTSPSGNLLAVAGAGGVQVFHFNGSAPITHYTGLLTTEPITEVFWDKNDHLYAISQSTGKLFVFTVTPSKFSQAIASPYSVPNPQGLVVISK